MEGPSCRFGYLFLTAVFLCTVFLSAGALPAAALEYPVAAYSAEELAKVREWEKVWAGKRIDKSNIEQVAEFMPASYVGIYQNPEKWGAPADGLFAAYMVELGIEPPVLDPTAESQKHWFFEGEKKEGKSTIHKWECPECQLPIRFGRHGDPELVHIPCVETRLEKEGNEELLLKWRGIRAISPVLARK